MSQRFLARVRVLVAQASNAWTRASSEAPAARRLAGLRYWDGGFVS
jgi:hypothetical protein